jgi:hypothetical protein
MVTHTDSWPTWGEFSAHLKSSAPVVVRVSGTPPVDLFVRDNGTSIGLRVPVGDEFSQPEPILAAVDIHVATLGQGPYLEVSTGATDLFPYFFSFALSLAYEIQVVHSPPDLALQRSLDDWKALFERIALLTPERELGLRGELWMLNRLLSSRGPDALAAWTGPQHQAHDFRIDGFEFEVKATSSERRSHLISSDTQLTASPNRTLYLLSLQFTTGGANGLTLHEVVEPLREALSSFGQTSIFDAILRVKFQLSSQTLKLYPRRLQLRSLPYLVLVDEAFPRISRTDVLSLSHPGMSRISDLRYRVDVDGLGREDNTAEFLRILPAGAS